RARSQLGALRARSCDLLCDVLAAQRAGDFARHRNYPFPARYLRAVPAADRARAAPVGAQQSGRIRSDAPDAITISNLRRILWFLCSVAPWRCRLLGHRFAEYPRLYTLCAQPTRP